MRTTVDLNNALVAEAMRLSQAKTKREALERGLSSLIRDMHIERLRSKLGSGATTWTLPELRRWRRGAFPRAH
jgi:Arc/MetJ family transcription regulator